MSQTTVSNLLHDHMLEIKDREGLLRGLDVLRGISSVGYVYMEYDSAHSRSHYRFYAHGKSGSGSISYEVPLGGRASTPAQAVKFKLDDLRSAVKAAGEMPEGGLLIRVMGIPAETVVSVGALDVGAKLIDVLDLPVPVATKRPDSIIIYDDDECYEIRAGEATAEYHGGEFADYVLRAVTKDEYGLCAVRKDGTVVVNLDTEHKFDMRDAFGSLRSYNKRGHQYPYYSSAKFRLPAKLLRRIAEHQSWQCGNWITVILRTIKSGTIPTEVVFREDRESGSHRESINEFIIACEPAAE